MLFASHRCCVEEGALEKLPFAEIKQLLEIRCVRISGATLLETRQNVLNADQLSVHVQKLISFVKKKKTEKKRKLQI